MTIVINEGFALQKIAGNHVIVPLAEKLLQYNGLFKLNDTAAYIFTRWQEQVPEEQIVRGLVEDYHMDSEQGLQWYRELAENLVQHGIVRVGP